MPAPQPLVRSSVLAGWPLLGRTSFCRRDLRSKSRLGGVGDGWNLVSLSEYSRAWISLVVGQDSRVEGLSYFAFVSESYAIFYQ